MIMFLHEWGNGHPILINFENVVDAWEHISDDHYTALELLNNDEIKVTETLKEIKEMLGDYGDDVVRMSKSDYEQLSEEAELGKIRSGRTGEE